MNRIAGSTTEVAIRHYRRRFVPVASTVGAMLLALLPIVTSAPILPDLAFMTLVTWRLLRPEIWAAQAALALGLLNDLITGNPIGQSMLLWTAAFLVFDLIDSRLGFRDYLMDWLIGGGAIILHTVGAWYIALLMGSDVRFAVILPQIGLGVLFYPVVARAVLSLDRWRLMR
jgi:rod shape-determining protein MreD